MMDLEFRFPALQGPLQHAASVLSVACPTPDVAFLLMLPREEMLRRMVVKAEPFPDAPPIRDARYTAYERLARSGSHTVIDGGAGIDEVHAQILAGLPGS